MIQKSYSVEHTNFLNYKTFYNLRKNQKKIEEALTNYEVEVNRG